MGVRWRCAFGKTYAGIWNTVSVSRVTLWDQMFDCLVDVFTRSAACVNEQGGPGDATLTRSIASSLLSEFKGCSISACLDTYFDLNFKR